MNREDRVPPPPGQVPLVTVALTVGLLLMAVQLWLLTVALDLFLDGHADQVWGLALISGAIFAGGLLMLWILRGRPRWRRPARTAAPVAPPRS